MDDLTSMNILQCHTYLNHPLEDLLLTEYLVVLLLLLDMECQVTNLTILHHNDQLVWCPKTFFVGYDIGMVQVFEQTSFHHTSFLFLLSQSLQDNLLGYVVFILLLVTYLPG